MKPPTREQPGSPLDLRELKGSLLLKGVHLESVQGLLEACPLRQLKAGELLIRAGEPNEHLYLLLSGHLRIHLDLDLDPIVILEPGDFVGEISLIDGHPTSAHAIADDDCRVLMLHEKTMWSLVDSSPAVALNILFVLAQRIRYGNSLILSRQQSGTCVRELCGHRCPDGTA